MYKKGIKILLNIFIGFIIICFSLFLFFALISYNELDPSFNTVKNSETVLNSMGICGSYVSDIFIQMFGFSSFLIAGIIAKIGFNKLKSKLKRYNIFIKIPMFMLFIVSSCFFVSTIFNNKDYIIYNNGGFIGYTIKNITSNISTPILIPFFIVSMLISFIILTDCSYRKIQIISTKIFRRIKLLIKLLVLFIIKIIIKILKKIVPQKMYLNIKNLKDKIYKEKKEKN